MTLQLSPEPEKRVAEALRSGVYQGPDEVIDRALEVLHEQDEWLTANRQSINAKSTGASRTNWTRAWNG